MRTTSVLLLCAVALLASLLAPAVSAQATKDLCFSPAQSSPIQSTSSSPTTATTTTTAGLPVFFFHGVTANATAGANFQQNLTAQGRVFVALNFCEDACSVGGLKHQVQLAIEQIRSVVQANPSTFANGYVFVGHSQGGAIARAVIEDMDDHDVRRFVSLAGAQNGMFYGPQLSDAIPTSVFAKSLGPKMIPAALMNFSAYNSSQGDFRGKLQFDFATKVANQQALQDKLSIVNLPRSPVHDDWVHTNSFLPVYNNLNVCEGDEGAPQCVEAQKRRRANFLRLDAAHFFASPRDEVISPWQASVFGQYSEVSSAEEIKTRFSEFVILPMTQTREYTSDSYGLQTLDKSSRLFIHVVENVAHSCWVGDRLFAGSAELCKFQPIYDKHIYPLL